MNTNDKKLLRQEIKRKILALKEELVRLKKEYGRLV